MLGFIETPKPSPQLLKLIPPPTSAPIRSPTRRRPRQHRSLPPPTPPRPRRTPWAAWTDGPPTARRPHRRPRPPPRRCRCRRPCNHSVESFVMVAIYGAFFRETRQSPFHVTCTYPCPSDIPVSSPPSAVITVGPFPAPPPKSAPVCAMSPKVAGMSSGSSSGLSSLLPTQTAREKTADTSHIAPHALPQS